MSNMTEVVVKDGKNQTVLTGNSGEDTSTNYLDLVPCGSRTDDDVAACSKTLNEAGDCEAVLDVQESFVSCVEGVAFQHEYETTSAQTTSLVDRVMADTAPPLSQHEAAWIRLQAMEQQQQRSQIVNPPKPSSVSEIDILSLNLCCTDGDDINDQNARSKQRLMKLDKSGQEQKSLISHQTDIDGTDVSTFDGRPRCAVCLDEFMSTSATLSFAKLPCCGDDSETDTVKICSSCVVLSTHPSSDGSSRVGRCPRCQAWISVRAPDGDAPLNLDISKVAGEGICQECNQTKRFLVDDGTVCDACFLGRRAPLLYECEQCHGTQRIPHPMYRYQASPDEYGKKTWSCEGSCQAFTHWRIRPDQIVHIPIGDSPFLPQGDWTTSARQRIIDARQDLEALSTPPPSGDCCIL